MAATPPIQASDDAEKVDFVTNLADSDLKLFAGLGIPKELLVQAGVVRVTDRTAREEYGMRGTGDMSGILFLYVDPLDGRRKTARLRRDNPEIEAGQPRRKYVSPFGDRRHLYFPPRCSVLLEDPTVPIILVEAEKSSLALTAFSQRVGKKYLPIAMGGCWGWRGRIGKVENAQGERIDETGPLSDLTVCRNRDVVVMLDSNADAKFEVRAARSALVRELGLMEAKVQIANLPALEGVNGPDDLIAIAGDSAMSSVLELAKPSAKLAEAEAEAAIEEILAAKPNISAEHIENALDALTDISDHIQRTMLQGRVADALRGVVPKPMIVKEVGVRRQERDDRRKDFCRLNREAALRSTTVDGAVLIIELERFFADRAYLPQGAALVLSYFALNTWTFKLFDTVPYLLLESAVPGCGKSTVIRLLDAVSCRSRKASALSEAVMFRLIDAEAPTLLIDEAETIDGRCERAEALRAIAHEGYKVGGQVPRCEGEAHEVRWFDVYCPKTFAAIGGLTGALLDRCIVIHIEKAPKRNIRKSTRQRALTRDVRHLVEQLEAYALQFSDSLLRLYETEPDCGYWPSTTDREAELWGPLLTHAKLAGPSAEARLLTVVDKFSEEKAEIKSTDSRIAQTIALLDAVSKHSDTTFNPGDLVPRLAQSESWARVLADAKGHDDDSVRISRAAKVGYFLRGFRLRGKKNSTGHMAYESQAAIACLSAHVPQDPPKSQQPPSQNCWEVQLTENRTLPESTEATEGSGFSALRVDNTNHEPSAGPAFDSLNSGSSAEVAVLPSGHEDHTASDAMMEGQI